MSRNRLFAGGLGAVVIAMVGASFAAVPLYRIFCSATGCDHDRISQCLGSSFTGTLD